MVSVGATDDEISCVLLVNPYFNAKWGTDAREAERQINRIRGLVESDRCSIDPQKNLTITGANQTREVRSFITLLGARGLSRKQARPIAKSDGKVVAKPPLW
jgi:hypothetical protein